MTTETVTRAANAVLPVARVPAAILASRIAEGATVVLLGTFLAARFVRRPRSRR